MKNGTPGESTNTKPKRAPRSSKFGQQGDRDANRRAAIVLEVLAGVRTPSQAADALGLSVNYYYVLERKALEGLLAACRPSPKGPAGPSLQRQLEQLERQLQQCRSECQRQAALVRATQRAVGLPAPPAEKPSKKKDAKGRKKRRRRPAVRALRAAESLRVNSSLENSPNGIKQGELEKTVSTAPPSSSDPSSFNSEETQNGPHRQEAASRSGS